MRYFFDVEDGLQDIRDEEGLELDSFEAARTEAVTALAEMAKSSVSERQQKVVAVRVRDDTGQILLKAFLTLAVEHVQRS